MFLSKEIEGLLSKFMDKVYAPDALSEKTKELIAFSNAIMIDCVPCIEHHYRKAREYGATREEIAETIAVTIAVCAGNKKAKYSKLIENLNRTVI